jgi:hypothetical protein
VVCYRFLLATVEALLCRGVYLKIMLTAFAIAHRFANDIFCLNYVTVWCSNVSLNFDSIASCMYEGLLVKQRDFCDACVAS